MPIQGVASDQYYFNPTSDNLNGVLNSTVTGTQSNPAVALLSDGRFVFVWQSDDQLGDTTGTSLIRARVFNADGTPQGSDFVVESTTAGDQQTPAVSALADGHFVVTWTSSDTGDGDGLCVRARVFDADSTGTADDDFLVNTTATSYQRNASVTTLASGNFIVTWESNEGPVGQDQWTIHGQIFDSSGTAVGGELDLNQILVGIKETPKIVAHGDGFIVAWENSGEDLVSPARYRICLFDASGNPTNPGTDIQVNTHNSNLAGAPPSISVLTDGRIVVAWESTDWTGTFGDPSEDGSQTCIRARILDADGNGIGNDFIVNTTTDNYQGFPSVVGLADGRFVIAWASFDNGDGAPRCIRGRMYNVDGTAAGDDFILNSITASDQFAPNLVALPDGRFVASWASSDAADASFGCLRAQIFDPKVFTGTGADDTWTGGNFGDTISGEAGADTLTGGLGKDRLTGGDDADVFNFDLRGETRKGAGRDVVTDFQHGIDDIDLSGIDAKKGGADSAFKWIGGQDFHHRKGELHFDKVNKPGQAHDKTIVEGDVNGDGRADFQIQLTGLIHLTKGDFAL